MIDPTFTKNNRPPSTPQEIAAGVENSGVIVDTNGILHHCYMCLSTEEAVKRGHDSGFRFQGTSSGLCNTHGIGKITALKAKIRMKKNNP